MQGLLERLLDNEKKLADAYGEAGDSLMLLGTIAGDNTWSKQEEARALPVVAPAILTSSKAAEACCDATRLHCAEPIRFHARCLFCFLVVNVNL